MYLILIVFLFLGVCLAAGILLFLRQPQFGRLPQGTRLEAIARSPNAVDGVFRNLVPTPMLMEGVSRIGLYRDFFFTSPPRLIPAVPLPTQRTNLHNLDRDRDLLIWFGHSSCFLQLGGKRFLIDPVFSPYAAPVSFSTRAFPGTDIYRPEDMPDIDYLIISHDHWDHLDYATVTALRSRIRTVICPLGVGEDFARWDFAPENIREGDWFDSLEPEPGVGIRFVPARHFSGRDLRTNRTLWTGYVIASGGRTVFYSGDTGHGPHLAEIGKQFGPFDLAILENGQYDVKWRNIHMLPEETAAAAEELGARALLPAHSGKFPIAFHSWDDPFRRIAAASEGKAYRLLTPLIGQPVYLDDESQHFARWWEGLE